MAMATRIGAYRSITRRPPSVLSGSRIDGIEPRMTIRSGGKASEKNTATGSRKNSLVSVLVSRARADMSCCSSVVDRATRQGHEGVVKGGLLDAQVAGDDVVAGEHGGHGEQQVAGAGHDELAAGPLDV